jgi:hypothetical protein
MKEIVTLLFIFAVTFCSAQNNNGVHRYSDFDKNKTKSDSIRGYMALTFAIGIQPALRRHGGDVTVKYAYTEYDHVNQSLQFKVASFGRNFIGQKFLCEVGLFGWEKNLNKRYTELKTGIMFGKQTTEFYLAYGMGYRRVVSEGRYAIRLGMGIFYTGASANLGRLDNTDKDIIIGSKVYHDSFKSSGNYRYQATHIKNVLTYNCFGLKPKLGIERISKSGKTSVRFNVGYNIPFYQITAIRIEQYSGSTTGSYSSFSINDPDFHYKFSGSGKHNSPYAVNGLFMNVELSCRVQILYKKQ